MAKRSKPRRKSALSILATLLILSAVIRVGNFAGQAVAREATEATPSNVTRDEERPEFAKIMEALSAREARVEEREMKLKLRMAALEEAEIEITNQIEKMRAAEASLRETLAIADQAAEKDVAQLTIVYENMKPKQAAALFETMEPAFAAGFLGRMKPAAAAGIMAGLTPEAAYAISVVVAGRNADAPTE